MIARVLLLLATLLAALAMTACGDEAKASDPPELKLGESTCSRCHMIISDERFASGLTFEDEDALLYDDLVIDAGKLRALGWTPRYASFREGWAEVLRWYQAERWVPRYE